MTTRKLKLLACSLAAVLGLAMAATASAGIHFGYGKQRHRGHVIHHQHHGRHHAYHHRPVYRVFRTGTWEEVHVFSLESPGEMPAEPDEVAQAQQEGTMTLLMAVLIAALVRDHPPGRADPADSAGPESIAAGLGEVLRNRVFGPLIRDWRAGWVPRAAGCCAPSCCSAAA